MTPLVHVFIDVPKDLVADTLTFWTGLTGWPAGSAWPGHPEFRSLEPAGCVCWLHVQAVEDEPRVHVDLIADDVDAEAARLVSSGAALVRRTRDWTTLQSPGGLPFCLASEPKHVARPEPASWPSGHRCRVRQVCLNIPADWWEPETEFWQDATGWRLATTAGQSGRPEYRWLRPPAGPQQLLLQRLDEPSGSVRAHLDVATDDIPAEVRRVRELGADQRASDARHDGRWVVLRDPAGLPFCITPQPP